MTDPSSLKVGETIEAPPLMKRLSSEPVLLTCTGKTEEAAEFAMTYYGVTLAHVAYAEVDGQKVWKWLS